MPMHILQQIIDESETLTCRSYSGRGMYGKTCLGVTLGQDNNTLGDFLATLVYGVQDSTTLSCLEELAESLRNAQTDSMGLGQIIYFPEIPYTEEEGEEEDFEEDEMLDSEDEHEDETL